MEGEVNYTLSLSVDNLADVLRKMNNISCSIVNGRSTGRAYDGVDFIVNVDMKKEDESSVSSEFKKLQDANLVVFYVRMVPGAKNHRT